MTLQQLRYAVTVAENKSINKAANSLFITQPSLSGAIKDLENELRIRIFTRSSKGISTTSEGDEFLGYARQMLEYYNLIDDKFISNESGRKKFSVSTQHYSFAVDAFIKLVKEFGMDEFEFALHETKTSEIIDNVKVLKSEIGILYLNDFNRTVLTKIFRRDDLEFIPLFDCKIYVFLADEHPLSGKRKLSMEQLEPYPCLSFEQGDKNSFYFAEEVLSTLDYKQIIKVDDRATALNFMKGLNGYTLCSGILCEHLNGEGYKAIPLDTDETMTIGYIKHQNMPLGNLAQMYVDELKTYSKKVLKGIRGK